MTRGSWISLMLLLIITSCKEHSKSEMPPRVIKQDYKGTGKLIPINRADSNYDFYRQDTALLSGWTLSYLVKDDSTRYKDLYIQWRRSDTAGLYYCGNLLGMGSSYVPTLVGESSTHIFLTERLGSQWYGVLTLGKQNLPQMHEYEDVLDYSVEKNKVVYVSPDMDDEKRVLRIRVADLTNKEDKEIVFRNTYIPSVPVGISTDTIMFRKDKVAVRVRLADKDDVFTEVLETRTVKF